MGCGCGKRAMSRPSGVATTTVAAPAGNASSVQKAQTFQSATIKRAPQGPVGNGRRTV